jgi:hypothetical protein
MAYVDVVPVYGPRWAFENEKVVMRMNLGLQKSSPVRRSGQEAQCIPLALLLHKEGGVEQWHVIPLA